MNDRNNICDQIAEDMKNDATNFDGQPFNGRTVAEYFGNHGAAIAALAKILKSLLEEHGMQYYALNDKEKEDLKKLL